jgi:hypothetical protein
MSVHMSVNASDIRHSVKAFLRAGDPSSGVWSAIWMLEQSSNTVLKGVLWNGFPKHGLDTRF